VEIWNDGMIEKGIKEIMEFSLQNEKACKA